MMPRPVRVHKRRKRDVQTEFPLIDLNEALSEPDHFPTPRAEPIDEPLSEHDLPEQVGEEPREDTLDLLIQMGGKADLVEPRSGATNAACRLVIRR